MKRNNSAFYRARAVATGAGNTIASGWSGNTFWNFEGGTTGWTAGANTTISQSSATSQGSTGSFSMRLAPSAAGTVSASGGGLTLTPVIVGGVYSATFYGQSPLVSRNATASISWYTSGAALVSTTTGAAIGLPTSGWNPVSVQGTAPATAAYAIISISIAGTSGTTDYQYVDSVSFYQATATVSVPALTNWVFRSLGSSGELNIVKDVKVLADLDLEQSEDIGVFTPMGRSAKVVVHGTVRGEDGTYNILCPDQATFDALIAVTNGRALILVADPFGDQKYVQIISRTYRKTGAAASPRYYVTLGYVEVESGLTAG
jgi:hypothetical protein